MSEKSRLFQKQSVVEIITDTLRHYGYRLGVDFDFKGLRGKYKRHEYITQYHETTFAFIQRLCAEEGLWFRFEQKHDRAVIIFGDDLMATRANNGLCHFVRTRAWKARARSPSGHCVRLRGVCPKRFN